MAEFIMIDTLWTSNEAQLDLIIVWTIHAKPIFFPEKNHSACIDSSNRLPFLFLKKKKVFWGTHGHSLCFHWQHVGDFPAAWIEGLGEEAGGFLKEQQRFQTR